MNRWLKGMVWGSAIAVIPTVLVTSFSVSQVPVAPSPSPIVSPAPPAIAPLQRSPANLGLDEQIWGQAGRSGDRWALIRAVDRSLSYLQTPKATEVYSKYPVPGVTRERVERSLKRFRQLLLTRRSARDLQASVMREFVFYQASGKDGQGTVAFTGYFEPVHRASRVRTAVYRYPLYRAPADLKDWQQPHPTREELEGADGLQGSKGRLRGLELVWLRDRLDAFLVQVQGSARLQLTDGSTMTVGYAGHTNHPYTGIGRELVQDGKLALEDLNLPTIVRYFQQHPAELSDYLPRNRRFVFFKPTQGAPAMGSIGVPVTAERSIATDKSLMPPGALALIQAPLPQLNAKRQLEQRRISRFVLDQDTGGAIIGPGRVDVFMGTGPQAGKQAGLVNSTGQLYYLLLK